VLFQEEGRGCGDYKGKENRREHDGANVLRFGDGKWKESSGLISLKRETPPRCNRTGKEGHQEGRTGQAKTLGRHATIIENSGTLGKAVGGRA